MFQQSSEEAQVTFQDASTYFSDAEWRLLQEWQKDLYVNVMREIHQALMSLGPLIANTVFSLKAKEAQELSHVGLPLSGERNGVNPSSSDPVTNPEEGFNTRREENTCVNKRRDKQGKKRKDCLSPDEDPALIFIDHLGKEVQTSSTDTSSGHETISITIKDEEEPYCFDDQGSKRKNSMNNSAGDPSSTLVKIEEEDDDEETQDPKEPDPQQKPAGKEIGSRNINAVFSASGTENRLVRKTLLEKPKVTEIRSTEKGPGPSSQLWLGNPHELGGEKSTQQFKLFATVRHSEDGRVTYFLPQFPKDAKHSSSNGTRSLILL
ncbi:hypothetical protein NDU88_000283 [Pleurodeles waltl]|uniref:KRAB domain-containing protein n=1 Tax=Pleurodeles waltl TaxID=8319 RepID=A0AAV7P3R5_PLEWA|nr:hypothetical protein NDU88_000283 [Pleurodeles waltl]